MEKNVSACLSLQCTKHAASDGKAIKLYFTKTVRDFSEFWELNQFTSTASPFSHFPTYLLPFEKNNVPSP